MEFELSRVIDALPGLVWTALPDGQIDFLNERWCQYTGVSQPEASGLGWQTAIHPEDRPSLLARWRSIVASSQPGEMEARLRRFDGNYRWFRFRLAPLAEDSGKVTKWCGIGSDIEDHMDRKRAEDALRASERSLDQIINTIPTTVWSTLPDGFCDFLNQRWLDYTGLTEEQALGWGWTGVIHPDDLEKIVEYWRSCLATGTPVDTELRMRRRDGTYRWFLLRGAPLRDEAGTIRRWYGTNLDIEDRKQAEEKLRRSEAFLAEGQRLSSTGSFSWHVDLGEVTFSEEACRIFEFEPGESVTLERIGSRVHPDDFPVLYEKKEGARIDGSEQDYQIRLRMPDGSIKYLHTISHGTRDREGRIECIGAIQDVTARRLAEEQLREVQEELAHVTRVTTMGELAASIAHEVNQPIAGVVINGNASLRWLSRVPDDSVNLKEARETIQRIIRDGNRAGEIIARIRTFFKKTGLAREPLDLNEAIREIIVLARHESDKQRVALRLELSADLPHVVGDRVQLQQVMLNLMLNGIDAMAIVEGRARDLVIRTQRMDEREVMVTVRDTGIGLSPESSDHVFKAFQTTKPGGLGMGLSISRSIVENHAGRLWVAEHEGPGASFCFTLPLHSPENGLEV